MQSFHGIYFCYTSHNFLKPFDRAAVPSTSKFEPCRGHIIGKKIGAKSLVRNPLFLLPVHIPTRYGSGMAGAPPITGQPTLHQSPPILPPRQPHLPPTTICPPLDTAVPNEFFPDATLPDGHHHAGAPVPLPAWSWPRCTPVTPPSRYAVNSDDHPPPLARRRVPLHLELHWQCYHNRLTRSAQCRQDPWPWASSMCSGEILGLVGVGSGHSGGGRRWIR